MKIPMKLIKFPLPDLRSAVGAFKSTDPVFCEEINSSSCVKSILTQFFWEINWRLNYENFRKFSKRNLKTIVALVWIQNCVIKVMTEQWVKWLVVYMPILTDTMEESPAWKGDCHSCDQEILCLWWNPKVYDYVCQSLPLDHVLNLINPATSSCHIYLLPFMPESPFRLFS
jgi:hypothetical protein